VRFRARRGNFLYDQREARFEFRRRPIFTNLLLAGEINRATSKTEAALLAKPCRRRKSRWRVSLVLVQP
jgi:ATPase family associated with various cellular activities (AAA)